MRIVPASFACAAAVLFTACAAPAASATDWWSETNAEYRFELNLPQSYGHTFLRDVKRQMSALRRTYEAYVPPQRPVGVGIVRIFATKDAFDAHLREANCGLSPGLFVGVWNPNAGELDLLSLDRKNRETLQSMRHEAFHQYLFYATGRGDHAMWFNEGHACLFESVHFDAAGNRVKVNDEGARAAWVARDPAKVAAAIRPVLALDHAAFYAGTPAQVNAHYVAAWAVCYFLEKGAPALPEFAAYRKVIPAYLAAMRAGHDAAEATREAWGTIGERDVATDFLKFWSRGLNAARAYEPHPDPPSSSARPGVGPVR